ncbi:MAG: ATP-dependent zinc protease [Phycisphaerales bacterium]|nr:ATP-dependent zinc protease [Phycisphaerales bacterium]
MHEGHEQPGPPASPITLGWLERVSLPEWGIRRLRVKCDTGAKTSAIDIEDVTRIDDDHVRFTVVFDRTHPERRRTFEAPIVRITRVKSSTGETTDRYVVSTLLRLGRVEKRIEVSLVSRHRMICRMLLGRTALSPEFVVDSSRKYLVKRPRGSGKSKKEV